VGRSNLYGCLAVLAAVAAIAIGLPRLDQALPGGRSVPTGSRVPVGRGVSLVAPPGTVEDLTRTAPAIDRLVLAVHGVRVVAEASAYSGRLAGLGEQLRRKIRSNPGYEASQNDHPTRTASGVPGLSGSYTTPGRIGMYAVFAAGGTGVEVSIAGSQTDLHRNYETLVGMVRSIRFGGS
jgi:hypothetical protein